MASAPFQLDYCEFACTAGSECEESSFSSEEEDIDPPSIPLLDVRGNNSATESRNETGRPHGDIFCVPSDARVASIQTQTFAGSSGVKMQFPENATVFDIFQAFLPENFVQKIVEYTNIYASQQLLQDNLCATSRIKKWHDTQVSEIYQFLALIFLMGICRLPTLKHYFCKDEAYGQSLFRKVMSGRRFYLLLNCLHFCDNAVSDPTDRIHKIRLIIDHFRQVFTSIYVPGENICVDESLMLWKGRLGFRQYIKSKRARFGIKSYEICESLTGYVYDFIMYTGKDTEYTFTDGNQGEKVVLTLLEPLLGKYYKVYTDRFFTSPTLARTLLANNTYICGTVMGNRKDMPKNFPGTKLTPGQISIVHSDGISCFAWQDKKQILMLSTMHHDSTMTNTGKTE